MASGTSKTTGRIAVRPVGCSMDDVERTNNFDDYIVQQFPGESSERDNDKHKCFFGTELLSGVENLTDTSMEDERLMKEYLSELNKKPDVKKKPEERVAPWNSSRHIAKQIMEVINRRGKKYSEASSVPINARRFSFPVSALASNVSYNPSFRRRLSHGESFVVRPETSSPSVNIREDSSCSSSCSSGSDEVYDATQQRYLSDFIERGVLDDPFNESTCNQFYFSIYEDFMIKNRVHPFSYNEKVNICIALNACGEKFISTVSKHFASFYKSDCDYFMYSMFYIFKKFKELVTLYAVMKARPVVCEVRLVCYGKFILSSILWKLFHKIYRVKSYPSHEPNSRILPLKESVDMIKRFLSSRYEQLDTMY